MICETEFKELKYKIEFDEEEFNYILSCVMDKKPSTQKEGYLHKRMVNELSYFQIRDFIK